MQNENLIQTSKQAISLAVTPFDNLTGDVEQDYFSRGFVEDLIIDLSYLRPNYICHLYS